MLAAAEAPVELIPIDEPALVFVVSTWARKSTVRTLAVHNEKIALYFAHSVEKLQRRKRHFARDLGRHVHDADENRE